MQAENSFPELSWFRDLLRNRQTSECPKQCRLFLLCVTDLDHLWCNFQACESPRRWCSGNMKPFQGLASGSIPERRKFLTF
jgi:hypothetical protein